MIEPQVWESWLNQHGPWLWHHTAPERVALIMSEGLRPASELGGSLYSDEYEAREGHVYLSTAGQWRPQDTVWLRIDGRQLDPARINPDEDAFIDNFGVNKAGAQGLANPDPLVCGTWISDGQGSMRRITQPVYASYGQWAQAIELGTDPRHTRYSLLHFGSIAHRGVIAPQLIQPHGPAALACAQL